MTRRRIDDWRAAVFDEPAMIPSAKLVALAMAEFMDFDTLGSARPGNPRLVAMTALSLPTVKRQLRSLCGARWLRLEHTGCGRGHASIYRGTSPQADLEYADLVGADLTGADVINADPTGADLTNADLSNVRYNLTTVWPADFDPPAADSGVG